MPWTDFAPKTILTIANYFADSTSDPKQAAERRWLLANFALETGQPREARELASRAAHDRPEYQPELEPFLTNLNAPAPVVQANTAPKF